jgi:proline iminopeptidase
MTTQPPRRTLFAETAPYATHRVRVSPLHELYVAEFGNPLGKPAICLHGGPGSGFKPELARGHDPERYRIILFDQRGCGRSTPHAELRENTTADLVDDIEHIRTRLGIERWQVTGGSWGSTLALAYAQTYPERVTELIVRGIFTGSRSELRWFYQEGASFIQPEAFERYLEVIPPEERHDLINAYHRRLTSDDRHLQLASAKAWSLWEGATISLLPNEQREAEFVEPDFALALARIESHYFVNGCFLRDGQLIEDATKLAGIPGTIIHGRYDLCTPMSSAWALHKSWPGARLVVVPDGGHTLSEPGITHELVMATNSYLPGSAAYPTVCRAQSRISLLDIAPEIRPASSPFLNRSMVGMPRIPRRPASSWFSSEFSLTKRMPGSALRAAASNCGPIT